MKRYDYYCDCFRNGYENINSRVVFRVVTSHYVSCAKNKWAKAKSNGQSRATKAGYRIPRKLISPEHFTDNNYRKKILLFCAQTTTFQQDDLFKRNNRFGAATVSLKS